MIVGNPFIEGEEIYACKSNPQTLSLNQNQFTNTANVYEVAFSLANFFTLSSTGGKICQPDVTTCLIRDFTGGVCTDVNDNQELTFGDVNTKL